MGDWCWSDPCEYGGEPSEIAAALLAAGWRPPMRVINTVEEAEKLPSGTLIQDRNGVFRAILVEPDALTVECYAPFRVVWEPEEER